MSLVVNYEFVFRGDETHGLGRRVPAINAYIERADGRIRPVLALLDTGTAISVFDGRIATAMLGFDPRAEPLAVVSQLGIQWRSPPLFRCGRFLGLRIGGA